MNPSTAPPSGGSGGGTVPPVPAAGNAGPGKAFFVALREKQGLWISAPKLWNLRHARSLGQADPECLLTVF